MESSSQWSVLSKTATRSDSPLAWLRGPCELKTENFFFLFLPGHRNRSGDQICQSQRQQELPAKRHQLVVTEARQCAPHPDIQEEKCKNLSDKPEHRQKHLQKVGPENRPVPSAEKQQRGQASHRNHVRVFRHEEHGKFHCAVFGVISGNKFGFGFGQVKGDAVCLRIGGHQVTEETNELP